MKSIHKKVLAIVLLLTFVLAVAGCSAEPKHEALEAKLVSFESLEEMEEYAGLIVECKRLEGEEAVITKVDGYVATAYSYSQVQITAIHKDSSGTYKVGDTITLLENEAYDKETKTVYHVADYNMLVPGKSYLLFLTHHVNNGQDYHVAAGVHFGTVSLEADGRDVIRSARTGNTMDLSYFTDIWNAAKDKYIK